MAAATAKPSRTTTGSAVGTERVDAVYARVSTRKQLDDLERQLSVLRTAHPGAREFSDCASGLNFKRKGLKALLQLAFEGRLRYVHVAHKDRLCRFAYDLIEHVLSKHGAQIVVDSQDQHSTSCEQDLADDVLAVCAVFGARLHGRRSGQGRKRKRPEQQEGEEGAIVARVQEGGVTEPSEDASSEPIEWSREA